MKNKRSKERGSPVRDVLRLVEYLSGAGIVLSVIVAVLMIIEHIQYRYRYNSPKYEGFHALVTPETHVDMVITTASNDLLPVVVVLLCLFVLASVGRGLIEVESDQGDSA